MKKIEITLTEELKERFQDAVKRREQSPRAMRRVLRRLIRHYANGGDLPSIK